MKEWLLSSISRRLLKRRYNVPNMILDFLKETKKIKINECTEGQVKVLLHNLVSVCER